MPRALDPGSLMPDRYGRAVCAAELRLRDEILAKIRDGRKPSGPFETPRHGGTGEKAKMFRMGMNVPSRHRLSPPR